MIKEKPPQLSTPALKFTMSTTWKKEMTQVRIPTNRGSVAYALPEKKNEDKGQIYADTVINGEVTELKTVSGKGISKQNLKI
jgi:hypothetical protein